MEKQTKEENKSLPAIKNKIAQSKGYKDWDDFFNWMAREGQWPEVAAQLVESAMEEVLHEYRNLPNDRNDQIKQLSMGILNLVENASLGHPIEKIMPLIWKDATKIIELVALPNEPSIDLHKILRELEGKSFGDNDYQTAMSNQNIGKIELVKELIKIQPEPPIDLAQERIDYYENKIEMLQRIINQKPEPSIQEDGLEEAANKYASKYFSNTSSWEFHTMYSSFKVGYEYCKQLNK